MKERCIEKKTGHCVWLLGLSCLKSANGTPNNVQSRATLRIKFVPSICSSEKYKIHKTLWWKTKFSNVWVKHLKLDEEKKKSENVSTTVITITNYDTPISILLKMIFLLKKMKSSEILKYLILSIYESIMNKKRWCLSIFMNQTLLSILENVVFWLLPKCSIFYDCSTVYKKFYLNDAIFS